MTRPLLVVPGTLRAPVAPSGHLGHDAIMLPRQHDEAIRIHRPTSGTEAAPWRDAFLEAYPKIFSEAPYHEAISPARAATVFDTVWGLPDAIGLIAESPEGDLAGFAFAVPLRHKRDVATFLSGLTPIKHTMYLAELGVQPAYRSRGLGRALVFERLKLMDPRVYTSVVLRVPEGASHSHDMYRALGFQDMGVSMEVLAPRTHGAMGTDRRQLLSRVLSQTDVE